MLVCQVGSNGKVQACRMGRSVCSWNLKIKGKWISRKLWWACSQPSALPNKYAWCHILPASTSLCSYLDWGITMAVPATVMDKEIWEDDKEKKVGKLWVWCIDTDFLWDPWTWCFCFLGCCCVLMLLQHALGTATGGCSVTALAWGSNWWMQGTGRGGLPLMPRVRVKIQDDPGHSLSP